ncbi:uncharacterized protein F5Z01DRAFT_669384 [Emericellopsis atlantica]|uniref:Uncharacterized protein n=1 Tax=Emericellopsis atlantica TaxID=2614577 RepID=A0A9P8CJY3_9HYPO|nr:uncharacterized protein F5Z01DRAFT_669384 [Emericellopsis atlantica]KAG9249375.1 hypothetical protein F5Z01DRAFT_669384 [Emericellopsis atlantica]
MQLMSSFLRATASFIVIYQRNAHRLAHVDNRLTAILLLSQSTMHELERELRATGTSLSPPDYAACVADSANDQTQLSAPGMPLVPRTSGPLAGGLCVAKGTPWLEPHDVVPTRSAGPDDDGTLTSHYPQCGSPITPSIDQIPHAVPPQVCDPVCGGGDEGPTWHEELTGLQQSDNPSPCSDCSCHSIERHDTAMGREK